MVDNGANVELLDQFIRSRASLNDSFKMLDHKYEDQEHIVRVKYELIHNQTEMSTYELIRSISEFTFIREVQSVTEMEKL